MKRITTEQLLTLDNLQMSNREYSLLMLRTAHTLQEIADLMNISKQRVAQILEIAIAKAERQLR
jgi:DNA-directed RNA polymerase sigma subunit (sigma70/sigma32)